MAIGLIFEANPYHFGHRYLINEASKLYPNDEKILISSTSFTMRGEISIINKFDKIKTYLKEGIDIVLELPTYDTLQSADYFALKTVKTLSMFNVNTIVIGCECTDLDLFDKLYQLINSKDFLDSFKDKNKMKLSYKIRMSESLKDLNVPDSTIELFNKPNMTLAFQYYKVIKDNNLQVKLHLIKRTNDFYQVTNDENNKIVSSSFIRKSLKNGEKICQFLPYETPIINIREAEKNLSLIINFQLLKNKDKITEFTDSDIANYIMKNLNIFDSFDDFSKKISNKTYSTSRIRRFLINYILDIKKINDDDEVYLRVLGFSKCGENYIKSLPSNIKKQLFSSPKTSSNLTTINKTKLNVELTTTMCYSIITNDLNLLIKEYQLPIKKEGI